MKLWKHSGGIAPSQMYVTKYKREITRSEGRVRQEGVPRKGVWSALSFARKRPKKKAKIRHSEYYDQQELHFKLYEESYHNLTLVTNTVHALIHATSQDTINMLLSKITLNAKGQRKLNKLRKMVSNSAIIFSTK